MSQCEKLLFVKEILQMMLRFLQEILHLSQVGSGPPGAMVRVSVPGASPPPPPPSPPSPPSKRKLNLLGRYLLGEHLAFSNLQ